MPTDHNRFTFKYQLELTCLYLKRKIIILNHVCHIQNGFIQPMKKIFCNLELKSYGLLHTL